ncbi:MAG: hypothetical protein JXR73_15385 [Candidatus Omnitrophica bacterium]|nr:hypothetical protein [Candidatus Omnitrophota bacterium]
MKKSALFLVFCVCIASVAMGQNIIIVTEQQQLEDVGTESISEYLRGQGYNVTLDPNATVDDSEYEGVLTDEEIAYLESFDVVVVHRSISSGDYDDDIAQWNNLNVPMLNGSAYLPRNNRWFWADVSQQRTVATGVNIAIPDHPIVQGLTGEFFSIPLGIDHLSPGDVGEGSVVATITNDSGEEANAIVVWEPDDAFTAAGGQEHTQARVFLPFYRYHENFVGSDPADGLFTDYTENGLKMIDQAIQYLMTFSEGSSGSQGWELFK